MLSAISQHLNFARPPPQTITRRSTSISLSPALTPMISRRGWGGNNNNNLIINAPPLRKDWGGKEGVE